MKTVEQVAYSIYGNSRGEYFDIDFDLAVKQPPCSTRGIDWGVVPLVEESIAQMNFMHRAFATSKLLYRLDNLSCVLDGSCPPNIVSCEGEKFVVDGNHRMLVLVMLGYKTVMCRVATA